MNALSLPVAQKKLPLFGGDWGFERTREEWITCTPPESAIAHAQRLRAARDARYRDIYFRRGSDMNWVGELGEMTLAAWLKFNKIVGTWHQSDPVGKPDLTVAGQRIGVKTVKRKVPMRPGWTAQITAKHATEPSDWFVFMSYEYPRNRMFILGGATPAHFMKHAVKVEAGGSVHGHYQIREGHEIYNCDVEHLIPPLPWLDYLCVVPEIPASFAHQGMLDGPRAVAVQGN